MTDLRTYLSPAHTWESELGTPWPEVTPLEELIVAAPGALQHLDKEPAQAITVRRQEGVPPSGVLPVAAAVHWVSG